MTGMRTFGIIAFATLLLFAAFLFVGCTGNGGTGNNPASGKTSGTPIPQGKPFSTNITVANEMGETVDALPAAESNQYYSADILPSTGEPPFACTLAPGSGLPGEISFMDGSCTLSGMAPELSSGTTKGEYPFSFYIKDANGFVAGPFTLTLTVVPLMPEFSIYVWGHSVSIGQPFEADFCDPPSTTPLNCGKSPASTNPYSGVPPYTFSATSLPLGLIMRSDGHLSGTVPMGTKPGEQKISVCAADSTGTEACKETTLKLTPNYCYPTSWHGTFSGNLRAHDWEYCGDYDFDIKIESDFALPLDLAGYMRYDLSEGFPNNCGVSGAVWGGSDDLSSGGSFTAAKKITSAVKHYSGDNGNPDASTSSSGALYTRLEGGFTISTYPSKDWERALGGGYKGNGYPYLVPDRCVMIDKSVTDEWISGFQKINLQSSGHPTVSEDGFTITGRWTANGQEYGTYTLTRTK